MTMELDTRIAIGQRLIVGFPGYVLDEEFRRLVKEYKIGNVILFRRNICSKEQLKALCADIERLIREETGYPPFITIDQEGGVVTRLSEDTTNVAGAMAVAQTGDEENAYRLGRITGRELNAMGVNFDLAPDVDVNSNLNNPVIGVRSYGTDPQTVIRYSTRMLQGLRDGGVLTCAKHFPGHGDTSVDSHLALPSVEKTREELSQTELPPFQAAIAQGVDSVMIAHVCLPKIEPKPIPATMSRRVVTDLLRNWMGFEGLILTDCMEMNAIAKFFGTPLGVKNAFCAGIDMAFVSHTAQLAREAARLTAEALETGELNPEEHAKTLQRILRYKAERLHAIPAQGLEIVGCPAHREENRRILKKSICVKGSLPALGEKPFFIGCKPFRATEASNREQDIFSFPEFLRMEFGGTGVWMSHDPTEDEIRTLEQQSSDASAAVVGTYQGHLHRGQLEVVRRIAALGIPTICAAMRDPYDVDQLPDSVGKICAFEYSEASIREVAARLTR